MPKRRAMNVSTTAPFHSGMGATLLKTKKDRDGNTICLIKWDSTGKQEWKYESLIGEFSAQPSRKRRHNRQDQLFSNDVGNLRARQDPDTFEAIHDCVDSAMSDCEEKERGAILSVKQAPKNCITLDSTSSDSGGGRQNQDLSDEDYMDSDNSTSLNSPVDHSKLAAAAYSSEADEIPKTIIATTDEEQQPSTSAPLLNPDHKDPPPYELLTQDNNGTEGGNYLFGAKNTDDKQSDGKGSICEEIIAWGRYAPAIWRQHPSNWAETGKIVAVALDEDSV